MPEILSEIDSQVSNLKTLQKEKENYASNIEDQQFLRDKSARQLSALQAVQTHLNQNTLHGITKELTDAADLDHSEFAHKKISCFDWPKRKCVTKSSNYCIGFLSSAPASPAILRLEAEKEEALEQEDYIRAQKIKEELDKERQKAPDSGRDWISWTKQLSRLNGRLQEPDDILEDLTKQLEQPDGLDSLVEIVIRDWYGDKGDIKDISMPLEELQNLVQEKLQATENNFEDQKRKSTPSKNPYSLISHRLNVANEKMPMQFNTVAPFSTVFPQRFQWMLLPKQVSI